MGSRVSRSTSLTSSRTMSVSYRDVETLARTSFRNLGEGQARTPLEIDIFRVNESAQRPKGLAREEVGLASLSVGSAETVKVRGSDAYILEILQ